jgi:hypothetical protein
MRNLGPALSALLRLTARVPPAYGPAFVAAREQRCGMRNEREVGS